MKKFIFLSSVIWLLALSGSSQIKAVVLDASHAKRCMTMERMAESLKKNPLLQSQWNAEGQKQYNAWLERKAFSREMEENAEIIIPVVFHIVDKAEQQAWITDRDIYEQVEILNQAYNGNKADAFQKVIPAEIYNRLGRVNIKFVLAKRTPAGALTSGIQRRVNASPDHISIKSFATGGLDAWDTEKYLNIWTGTFSGDDDGLLGVATFPFTTDEGPQGVVIGTATLPYTSNITRGYYPAYSEGATLAHEIGHYFYLWHTFGDKSICNNDDFKIQSGWPLPAGAGPEGDDTPHEKAGPGYAYFGNPSQNYSDGCTNLSFGMMYGSFMNYFDDRALFMFSEGHRKRVEGCIEMYRNGLKTSDGATPPVPVTDAYLVNVSSRGLPERREHVINNTPFSARIRNYGTTLLTSVVVNVQLDALAQTSTTFSLNLEPGSDTVLILAPINGSIGAHTLTVSVTSPNGDTDAFPGNDGLQSFIYITGSTITAPFTESFTSSTFPPTGWQVWNPQENTTWVRNAASGYTEAGTASVQNYNYNGGGQLDELLTPAIELGGADSALLQFKVAHGVYSNTDVSVWDALEVYISNNGGETYQLAYKKSGNQLKTISSEQTSTFTALPSTPERWRNESINLTPYINPGKKILVKFRNINAYGNNLYLDDIEVSVYSFLLRDAYPAAILNIPNIVCGSVIHPSVSVGSDGSDNLSSLNINYSINNGTLNTAAWTGSLKTGEKDTLSLPAISNLTPGKYILTVFTSAPNGLTDEDVHNDTISKTFYIIGEINSPVTESFESGTFPPATWALDNPDNGITWEKAVTGASGNSAMIIKNYNQVNAGTQDQFISSIVKGNPDYDSLFVSFDYAYAPGINLPGTNRSLDTLEIQVTSDCGQTFTTIWKKWGNELLTIADPDPAVRAFVPTSADWKRIRLYLTPDVGMGNFQVYFVAKSNQQNNLYVDDINIYGIKVPPRLKQQGYLVYPSPFTTQFIIRNYEEPVNFRSAAVYNSAGQRVWRQEFNGTAQKEVTVNLGKLPAGIYTVQLNYTDKTVFEKILKL